MSAFATATLVTPSASGSFHPTKGSSTTDSINETFKGATSQAGGSFQAPVKIVVVNNVVQGSSSIQFITSDGQCSGQIGSYGPWHFRFRGPLKNDNYFHRWHFTVHSGPLTAKNTAPLRFLVNPKAGVIGSFTVKTVFYDSHSKVVSRCSTGNVIFTAAPFSTAPRRR